MSKESDMPKRIQLRRGCAYYSSRDVWDDGIKRDDEVEYVRADLAEPRPALGGGGRGRGV